MKPETHIDFLGEIHKSFWFSPSSLSNIPYTYCRMVFQEWKRLPKCLLTKYFHFTGVLNKTWAMQENPFSVWSLWEIESVFIKRGWGRELACGENIKLITFFILKECVNCSYCSDERSFSVRVESRQNYHMLLLCKSRCFLL